jgi:EAL domain-containing protein (putative c-di-GMP-specific phosphodiesterase class I)
MDEADFMMGCLAGLREFGFGIVLDKIGSSYSTFSRWLKIPLTGIRIDEALTLRAQFRADAALIEALFKIASIRGLDTTAAGVHHAEASAVLTLLGVHRLQGEYFGPTLDCQSFMQRLSDDGPANWC